MRFRGGLLVLLALPAAAADPFAVHVVDADTGRGVPLVELRTVHNLVFLTDSAGLVAVAEPGLMNQETYFAVKSHGYEYPKDPFGYSGVRLRPTAGGTATVKLKRVNVAERLCRLTGEGVYRDSVLLGRSVPLKEPLLNARVVGQDSTLAAVYRGKPFWIWGDTSLVGYPLGNFGAAGATSDLPGQGGLDPADGVNYTYFVDAKGASRPMVSRASVPGPGPIWLGGLTTLPDPDGRERLVASYARVEGLVRTLERGFVAFDDEAGEFKPLKRFDVNAPMYLDGHPVRAEQGGVAYLYSGGHVPPMTRVRADWASFQDLAAYEGFTCLPPGGRFARGQTKVDRGPDGRLVWGWKKDTPPLAPAQQEQLVKAGVIRREEVWHPFRDIDTGKAVRPHAGSVRWNPYRKRWVAVFCEIGGTSQLGETWYAEADGPAGPWAYAKKVVTHDRYSFYNPVHHPFFDQDGGRRIYFEGTYTAEFSGNPEKTPRYDYNQILYRLDLADGRLALPAPVYRVAGDGGRPRHLFRDAVEAARLWDKVEGVAFFAIPPDRKRDGLVAVPGDGSVAFLVAPDKDAPGVVPLYEFRDAAGGRSYSIRPEPPAAGWQRAEKPVGRVWANPIPDEMFDRKGH